MSELQRNLHLIYGTLVNNIQGLRFTEMCARCVPRNLTDEKSKKQQSFALSFWQRYSASGQELRKHVITKFNIKFRGYIFLFAQSTVKLQN